jgi:hypothetical protein
MTSRGYKNPFKKPTLDNSEENFPRLATVTDKILSHAPTWNCSATQVSDTEKTYPSGTKYDGYYDENGKPVYGKIKFKNGDVYEGPIHYSWDKDDEEYEDLIDQTGYYYDNYFYSDYLNNGKYGVMRYPNGKEFWGVFYFSDSNKW